MFLPHSAEPAYHTFRAERILRIHNEWIPSEVSRYVISEVCNANHCEPTGSLDFFLLMPSCGVMVNYTHTMRNRMWRRNFIWSSIWPVESMEDTRRNETVMHPCHSHSFVLRNACREPVPRVITFLYDTLTDWLCRRRQLRRGVGGTISKLSPSFLRRAWILHVEMSSSPRYDFFLSSDEMPVVSHTHIWLSNWGTPCNNHQRRSKHRPSLFREIFILKNMSS